MSKRWQILLILLLLLPPWPAGGQVTPARELAFNCWVQTAEFRRDAGAELNTPAGRTALISKLLECIDAPKPDSAVLEEAKQRIAEMVFFPRTLR